MPNFKDLHFPNSLAPVPTWVRRRINRLTSGGKVSFCQRLGVWYAPASGENEWVRVIKQGSTLAITSPSPKQPTESVLPEEFKALWQQHFGRAIHPLAAQLIAGAKCIHPKYHDNEETLWLLDKDSVSFVVGFDSGDKNGIHYWNIHLPSSAHEWIDTPPTEYWLNGHEPHGSRLTSWLAGGNPYCAIEIKLTGEDTMASAIFGGERPI